MIAGIWDRVSVVAPPVSPVMTVDDIKLRLRISTDAEDAMLESLVAAVTSKVDGPRGIGWGMMEQTWRLSLDAFPCDAITLPGAPVQSVAAITYEDSDGVIQTLDPSAYRVDLIGAAARIAPAYGTSWPPTRTGIGAVLVDYVVGVAAPQEVPQALLAAIALWVGNLYEHREAVVLGLNAQSLPFGVKELLMEFRQNAATNL